VTKTNTASVWGCSARPVDFRISSSPSSIVSGNSPPLSGETIPSLTRHNEIPGEFTFVDALTRNGLPTQCVRISHLAHILGLLLTRSQ
jgi:hypothetical protein